MATNRRENNVSTGNSVCDRWVQLATQLRKIFCPSLDDVVVRKATFLVQLSTCGGNLEAKVYDLDDSTG